MRDDIEVLGGGRLFCARQSSCLGPHGITNPEMEESPRHSAISFSGANMSEIGIWSMRGMRSSKPKRFDCHPGQLTRWRSTHGLEGIWMVCTSTGDGPGSRWDIDPTRLRVMDPDADIWDRWEGPAMVQEFGCLGPSSEECC